ncbi:alpha/beta hydrolase [Paucibacter sp. R3-3]|uniref:Alpha/beta hydrolase n=1 Tax=Roseateles agri TaxID=3098619 RepID=A0ABU5DQU4_9BURK|nr:alpha/beta hydrolase [Paucibacter sp. R3-3]MDY0748098.1 alpha/beta hydrolase [Paucibacter sp. R3-3]
MHTRRSFSARLITGSAAALATSIAVAEPQDKGAASNTKTSRSGSPEHPTRYHSIDIDGSPIFYREAGAPGAPVVLMLHGWPSSSAMFRDLIRELSTDYHVFAPDYPGFGNSGMPSRSGAGVTFDTLGDVMNKFVDKVGIRQFSLYATDFGGLVGYRLMLKSPQRVKALIAQNNPLFLSESPWFGPLVPYWKDGTSQSRDKARAHYLSAEVVRDLYVVGVRDISLVDPEQWQSDHALLQRPEAAETSLDLLYDIRTNGATLKAAQEYFAAQNPPALIVSGKNDILFSGENQLRYREVLPDAKIHLMDSGHCALADKSGEIAELTREFLRRAI